MARWGDVMDWRDAPSRSEPSGGALAPALQLTAHRQIIPALSHKNKQNTEQHTSHGQANQKLLMRAASVSVEPQKTDTLRDIRRLGARFGAIPK